MFEIVVGIVLSAWKVTKAVKVSLKTSWPFISIEDKQEYATSPTRQYDRKAVKFMSYALGPCLAGYCVYALKYHRFKSWRSYVLSCLAGTVYTFGFIMMTPQLYINYKLKSVDHLPWRALVYKALNTFVDDIAALIVDMPWMHRIACFRDDIIFICYIYQRWIYATDKTRPSEWMDPALVAKEVEKKKALEEKQKEDELNENKKDKIDLKEKKKDKKIEEKIEEITEEEAAEIQEAARRRAE
eukprot:Trichotokara_eunicae@DN78_c0_g1_i1.p1